MYALTFQDIADNRIPLLKPLNWLAMRFNAPGYSDSQATRDLSLQKARSRMAQGNSRDDFFAHLLSDKRIQVTEDYLASQSLLLLIAGSETTSTTLSALAWYLSDNPKAMSRVKAEVREAFESSEQINADTVDARSLPYLSAVIEETLRVFPLASFGLPRFVPAGGAEIDGAFVPEGTIVSTANWTTQRTSKSMSASGRSITDTSGRYWHDSENFHPERWLAADHQYHDPIFAGDNHEAFKPFSLGPRVCLGMNMAYMEMRLVVTKSTFSNLVRTPELFTDRDG